MNSTTSTGTNWARRTFRELIGIDVRSLAIVRMLLASILLVDWCLRWIDFDAFYSDSGMVSLAASRTHLPDPGRWSLHWLSDSPVYQHSLFAGAALAAACLLVGWQTRWATFASWVFVVSFWQRNPLVCNYGDSWLRILLFWCLFLPLGATWSVDAWRRVRRGLPSCTTAVVASTASACILLQLSLFYLFAGLWKWNDSWLGGQAVFQALQIEYARRATATYLLEWPGILGPLTRATLVLELLGPLVIWLPWRTGAWRVAMIGAFVLLHVSIEICFRPLMLSYISMAPWFLLVPASLWESRWLVGLTNSWNRLLARTRSKVGERAGAASCGASRSSAPSLVSRATKRLADVTCMGALAFVALWNVATFSPERLGWLMPVPVRPVAQITMLWQTWDMFYVPQTRNSWLVAEARLRDGRRVDLLHDDRPFDRARPDSNFDSMPNPRWRLFFDRLAAVLESRYHQDVADYLLRTANEHREGGSRVLSLDLLRVERTTAPDSDSPGYRLRPVATAQSDDSPPEESLQRIFDALDRDLGAP